MRERKYGRYISRMSGTADTKEGVLKFHKSGVDKLGPRYKLMWDDVIPDSNIKVIVRRVQKGTSEFPEIMDRHIHDVSKAYVFLSEDPEGLEEEVTLGDEKYTVKSPAAVFVPAGIEHDTKILKGYGFHIVIMAAEGNYDEHTFPVSK